MLAILDAFRLAWHAGTISGPYLGSALDLLQGVAFLLAAFGVYRFDSRVQVFAVFLTVLVLLAFGVAVIFVRAAWIFGYLAACLCTLIWSPSSAVKARFLIDKGLRNA